jgi:phosphate transport system substrate-binding protein
MLPTKPLSILALALGVCLATPGFSVEPTPAPVRVRGVAALSRVMKAASLPLREMGIDVKVGEDCNNAQALEALGNNQIDIALIGRHLNSEDRAAYPDKTLQQIRIGTQTIALMVPRSVWESGVRALKKDQMAKLYEGKIGTWDELGGENRSTKFFEPAHGMGVWEIFVGWLYGDTRKAPAVKWEVVNSGAEAQNAVQFFSGAVTVASMRWADGKDVFPIAIMDDSGNTIEPTAANVAAGTYPMTRPAYAVVGLKPSANRRKVLEFLLSDKGQEIVADNELLPVTPAEMRPPK